MFTPLKYFLILNHFLWLYLIYLSMQIYDYHVKNKWTLYFKSFSISKLGSIITYAKHLHNYFFLHILHIRSPTRSIFELISMIILILWDDFLWYLLHKSLCQFVNLLLNQFNFMREIQFIWFSFIIFSRLNWI